MPKSLHVVRLGESCVVHLIPGTKMHLWVLWYRYCSKNHKTTSFLVTLAVNQYPVVNSGPELEDSPSHS